MVALSPRPSPSKGVLSFAEKVFVLHTHTHFIRYYSLNYEDVVAGKPVRFKYVQVPPKKYGMSVRRILDTDDRVRVWVALVVCVG